MSEIKKVKLPNDSTIYDIDATTVNGHTVDIDVPNILKDLPTGSISTVNDAAPLPLNALKVSVEAVQSGSGTPSPSNIRPIIGWDSGEIGVVGKNWVKQVIQGYINTGNSIITIDNGAESVLFYAKQGVKYTVSSQSTFNRNVLAQVDADNVTQGTPVYNITNHSDYTWEAIWTGWTVWYVKASRDTVIEQTAQVEIGTTATTYEPYNGKTATADFNQAVYGGSANLLTGEGVLTYLLITENDFEDYYSSESGGGLHWVDYPNENVKLNGNANCNMLAQDNANAWNSTVPVLQLATSSRRVRVYCNDESLANFKTTFNGLQICYELAEPIPFTFTPIPTTKMLQGTNNVYADCGDIIDGEYFVDSDLTDNIVSVAEKINTDTNDKVTQTEVPNATSGTDYYSLTFAKDHNTNTNTDGLYKTGSVVVYKNAFNNIPGLAVNDTNNPNSLTKSSDIAPGQITIAEVVSNTPKTITVSPDDIALTNNTWDGTNASLKNTLANIDAKNVTMTASSTDERMHVLVNANNHTSGEAGAVEYGGFLYNPSRNAMCNIQNLDDPDGYGSIAWGSSVAPGDYSQSMGYITYATHKCQHVFGAFNVRDPSTASTDQPGTYIEIVGNGIINSSNARTLDWNGNEWIAGTLTQGSSKKIKKNISPITEDEISKVLELNGVKFDYVKTGTNNQAERGFIAEEVAEVLPNLVTEEQVDKDGNTLKPASLNYLAIIPYLVEICKRQQKEIDELKSIITRKS